MAIGKIKPTATLVAQFVAGVEVECIQHEGKLFLPVVNLGEFAEKEPAPTKDSKTKAKPAVEEEEEEEVSTKLAKPAKASKKDEATSEDVKSYTEDELMDMDVKSLQKILKGMGVDPDEFEGKNTNKKLRLLILDNQGEVEEEEEAPTKKSKKAPVVEEEAPEETDALQEDVVAVLEDFDSGKLTAKKAVTKLAGMAVEEVSNDKISKILKTFEDDADTDIEKIASSIVSLLKGEKPKKAAEPKKEAKERLVSPEDLEVGNRVSVYWEDQEEWYEGEVSSIKKGKVTIDYDDDTQEVLDENNTKIKLLP